MNKKELLKKISELSSKNVISKQDILDAYDEGSDKKTEKKILASKILYYVGAIIIFLGIIILIGQYWDSFNSFMRIFIILGGGIISFIIALFFSNLKLKDELWFSSAFYLLAGFLLPLGSMILLFENGVEMEKPFVHVSISLILIVLFSTVLWFKRKFVLLSFVILYLTWFFISITDYFYIDIPFHMIEGDFIFYRFMIIGIVYMLLGEHIFHNNFKALTPFLRSIGSFIFLLFGFIIAENSSLDIVADIINMIFIIIIMYFSIYKQTKTYLIVASLFLIINILKISFKYFENIMGWSISLIIAGFFLIVVGYVYIYLNKEHIKNL